MKKFTKNNQQGFTLIELMIAITISVILLNGVLQIFQSSKQSYRIADNIGRIQENARYALSAITNDIRQAGFLPCRINIINGNDQVINALPALPPGENAATTSFFSSPIIGYEGGASAFPAEFQGEGAAFGTRLAGSDAFRVLRGSGTIYTVAADGNPATKKCTNAGCELSSTHNLDVGDVVLICSTEGAALVQLTAADQGAKTITHNANILFPIAGDKRKVPAQGSQVTRLISSLYYVGASLATDGDALPTNSLYRRDIIYQIDGSRAFSAPQELVQGIETMQIVYGVAVRNPVTGITGAAVRYVTADNVGMNEWNNVVSARIGILFHTPEEISPDIDSATYNVVGTAITTSSAVAYPADRRQRYVFSETVKIRNRGASVAIPPASLSQP